MAWVTAVVAVAVLWWCPSVTIADGDLPWWKTATLYQVYPSSFKDSDGDGLGDLKGITQSAEYFKEIGVDAIWLSPIYKSPMVDSGYDISDFRNINPIFGTLDDFKELSAKMRSLDIKLLLDFVPNHCSDQHEWFNKSLQKIDPYTDYFVWEDGKIDPDTGLRIPPDNWVSVFDGSAWEWRKERNQYYLHLFTPQQIDLNFKNPAVVKEFDDIMTYWLDLGIDGFRMDAVMFLVEGNYSVDEPQLPGTFPVPSETWEDYNHTQIINQDATFELITHWDQLVRNYSVRDGRERALFMEAYTDEYHTLKFYGHGDLTFAMPFNFNLLGATRASRSSDVLGIIQYYLSCLESDETPNWVVGNHDNLRVADRDGPEAVDAVSMLQGILPGIKVVYYGEEIGMQDTFVRWDQTVDPKALKLGPARYLEQDRDPFRSPMQWDDSEPSGGFSTADKTWLPVNPNFWWLNVEAQRKAARSHLKVFQDMSRIRQDRVLQRGKTVVVAPDNDTLAVIRSNETSFYVYIFNIGSEFKTYTTENFFVPHGLNASMSVEVVSVNCRLNKGTVFKPGSTVVSLRPKAAVILKSPPSAPSSAIGLLVTNVLLIFVSVIHLST